MIAANGGTDGVRRRGLPLEHDATFGRGKSYHLAGKCRFSAESLRSQIGFGRTDATSSKLVTFVLGLKPALAKVHEQQRAAVRFAARTRPLLRRARMFEISLFQSYSR